MTETETDDVIKMSPYKMSHGKALRVLAGRHLCRSALLGTLIVVVMIVLAFAISWKFVFVALLLVFIVYPMLLMWLYVRHCLTLDVVINTMEHTVAISREKLTVTWRPSLFSGERDAEDENVAEDDSRVPVALALREDEVPMSRVIDISYGINAITIWLKDIGKGAGFLYIPYETIPEGKAEKVIEYMK